MNEATFTNGEVTYLNGDAVEETRRIDNNYGCTAICVRVIDGERKNEERVVMVETRTLGTDEIEVTGTMATTASVTQVVETGLIDMVRNGEYGVPLSEWNEGSVEMDGMVESNLPYYEVVETVHFAVRRNDRIYVMRVKKVEVEYQNSRGNWKTAQLGML